MGDSGMNGWMGNRITPPPLGMGMDKGFDGVQDILLRTLVIETDKRAGTWKLVIRVG